MKFHDALTGVRRVLGHRAVTGGDEVGVGRREDAPAADAAQRRCGGRPWLAVVHAGAPCGTGAALLAEGGVPTFPTADRALELRGRFSRGHLEPTMRRRTR